MLATLTAAGLVTAVSVDIAIGSPGDRPGGHFTAARAFAAFAGPAGGDHFKCYELGTHADPSRSVRLDDEFGGRVSTVGDPVILCNPVRKSGSGIQPSAVRYPFAHLVCYQITDVPPPVANRRVVITNQLGQWTVTATRAQSLCVPSLKKLLSGKAGSHHSRKKGARDAAHGVKRPVPVRGANPQNVLDHFECYAVIQAPVGRKVKLTDEFGTTHTRVIKLVRLCNPVQKTIGRRVFSIKHPALHLACYAIQDDEPFSPRDVVVSNQFGTEQLHAASIDTLCVPSYKQILPPPTFTTGSTTGGGTTGSTTGTSTGTSTGASTGSSTGASTGGSTGASTGGSTGGSGTNVTANMVGTQPSPGIAPVAGMPIDSTHIAVWGLDANGKATLWIYDHSDQSNSVISLPSDFGLPTGAGEKSDQPGYAAWNGKYVVIVGSNGTGTDVAAYDPSTKSFLTGAPFDSGGDDDLSTGTALYLGADPDGTLTLVGAGSNAVYTQVFSVATGAAAPVTVPVPSNYSITFTAAAPLSGGGWVVMGYGTQSSSNATTLGVAEMILNAGGTMNKFVFYPGEFGIDFGLSFASNIIAALGPSFATNRPNLLMMDTDPSLSALQIPYSKPGYTQFGDGIAAFPTSNGGTGLLLAADYAQKTSPTSFTDIPVLDTSDGKAFGQELFLPTGGNNSVAPGIPISTGTPGHFIVFGLNFSDNSSPVWDVTASG